MLKHTFLFCLFFPIISHAGIDDYFIKIDKHSEVVIKSQTFDSHDYGSAIQWNKDYAVTAKHVSFAEGSVYTCSENCDIRFIKRKAESPLYRWRSPKPFEPIIFAGNSSGSKTHISQGEDLNIALYMSGSKVENKPFTPDATNTVLYATNAKVVHGQSGGPVIGKDGEIIGMVIGETQVVQNGKEFIVSLYIPYNTIQKEWNKFQTKS